MQGGSILSARTTNDIQRVRTISSQFEYSEENYSEDVYFVISEEHSEVLIGSDGSNDLALIPCLSEEMEEIQKLQGLYVKIEKWEMGKEEKQYLSIRTDSALRYVFSPFIKDINDEDLNDPLLALDSVIEKWRDIWRRLRNPLNAESERGLFGELSVLERLILSGCANAVNSWKGPLGETHDFKSKTIHLEIKTTKTHPPQIKISSARQMYTVKDKSLLLIILQLEESEDGSTLPERVKSVEDSCSDNSDYDTLQDLLQNVGYSHDDAESYSSRYQITNILELNIDESSPVITRSVGSTIPSNVKEIKYTVDLTGIPLEEIDQDRWAEISNQIDFEHGGN